ncbi:hypothetical protein Holit_02896 [Hollandina sp. SP2]
MKAPGVTRGSSAQGFQGRTLYGAVKPRSVQPSLQGWIAAPRLTAQRIGSSGTRASGAAQEPDLAGKGLSEAEDALNRQEDRFKYAVIAAMESRKVSAPAWSALVVDRPLIK